MWTSNGFSESHISANLLPSTIQYLKASINALKYLYRISWNQYWLANYDNQVFAPNWDIWQMAAIRHSYQKWNRSYQKWNQTQYRFQMINFQTWLKWFSFITLCKVKKCSVIIHDWKSLDINKEEEWTNASTICRIPWFLCHCTLLWVKELYMYIALGRKLLLPENCPEDNWLATLHLWCFLQYFCCPSMTHTVGVHRDYINTVQDEPFTLHSPNSRTWN